MSTPLKYPLTALNSSFAGLPDHRLCAYSPRLVFVTNLAWTACYFAPLRVGTQHQCCSALAWRPSALPGPAA